MPAKNLLVSGVHPTSQCTSLFTSFIDWAHVGEVRFLGSDNPFAKHIIIISRNLAVLSLSSFGRITIIRSCIQNICGINTTSWVRAIIDCTSVTTCNLLKSQKEKEYLRDEAK